jgi:hypothetical protein
MGLDMYLEGQKYFLKNWKEPEKDVVEDGYRVKRRVLELGYWRKHPDLHGYIVKAFADGVDECQEIDLGKDDLCEIINAVKEKRLPRTTGFFFGASDGSEDEETIEILTKAIAWLQSEPDDESRSVVYRASW